MCLVEINKSFKPIVACANNIYLNLEIFTDTLLIKKAREHILEFLLINHPLIVQFVIKVESVIYRIKLLFLEVIMVDLKKKKDLSLIKIGLLC